MRFRSTRKPPPFTMRSTRGRLFRLGMGLVVVLAAIKVASDPATWAWLFSDEVDRTTAEATLADVEYDVDLGGDEPLAADEFRSEPEPTDPIRPIRESETDSQSEDGSSILTEGEIIPGERLDGVEDNTLGLHRRDRRPYFEILAELQTRRHDELPDADASGTFPVVMTEPEHYRGRMIEIEGLARRILEIPAGENDAGFETLFELWVFTPDSGKNPWRVVATSLPPSLSQRGVIEAGVPVRLSGVFFKREGYETQHHALHVAPLLLAKTVERVVRPSTQIASFDPRPWVFGTLAIVIVVFGLLFWRFRREDRAFEQTTLDRFTSKPDEDEPIAPAVTTLPPEEFFAQLEREASVEEPRPLARPGEATSAEGTEFKQGGDTA